ncbi:MAG: hypothetical protein WBD71_03650 [Xanthobacteraceae bacterium]
MSALPANRNGVWDRVLAEALVVYGGAGCCCARAAALRCWR